MRQLAFQNDVLDQRPPVQFDPWAKANCVILAVFQFFEKGPDYSLKNKLAVFKVFIRDLLFSPRISVKNTRPSVSKRCRVNGWEH